MESMMAANIENHSPEISGLLAANSGFALVEAAVIPVSLRIRAASLWFVAAISLGGLAVAGGATVAGDGPAVATVAELPVAAEAVAPAAAPAPAQSTAARTAPVKNPGVQPVVLRGQPLAMGRRS
jgi:hypothetical protein